VKFEQFQFLAGKTFGTTDADGTLAPRFEEVEAERLPPLVLAYIGDAYFNLYVRTKLLFFEQSKVRVLHLHGAKIVSATMQAFALKQLEPLLSEAEAGIVRRGRNAKSNVPKSASVSDYRYSTGFEALMGFLYLRGDHQRLDQLASQAFTLIAQSLANIIKDDGEEK
jgi:ribonuclease-3 family protein